MNILALDLGQNLGYAVQIDKKVKYGSVDLHNRKFDGAGMRYLRFRQLINNTIIMKKIEWVVYEGVRKHLANATDSQHVYGGFMAELQSVCEKLKVPYCAYGVGTIKKAFAGKGSATKADMIRAARLKGYNPKNDNEADALGVLHTAIESNQSL